jgi:hypothetical protein
LVGDAGQVSIDGATFASLLAGYTDGPAQNPAASRESLANDGGAQAPSARCGGTYRERQLGAILRESRK